MAKMLKIVFETSSFIHLIVGLKSQQPDFRYILPKLAILFDELLYFGDSSSVEMLKIEPYGRFIEVTNELLKLGMKFSPASKEQINDLKEALGDEPNSEGGNYAYYNIRGLLAYAKENKCYIYTLPGFRHGFLKFCYKYEPDYLPIMKESFLLCTILETIFMEEIPSFDPIKSKDNLTKFTAYKQDFQKGILNYLNQFKGGYDLSRTQRQYLKKSLANDEKRLLDFLQPDNLKKFDLSKTIQEAIGEGISLFFPMPLGLFINIGKELEDLQAFKKANLGFPLSLIILKKITNVGTPEGVINCVVCEISPFEIECLSDAEANEIIYQNNLCIEHIVAGLDLRKRFGLYGKSCLKQMKRLGDASIWMEPK